VVDSIAKSAVPSGATERMVEAISIRTVSFENSSDFDSSQFLLFNEFLYTSYPTVFSQLEHQTFNEFSHLLKWQGTDQGLEPVVLMAHLDVVPIASPRKWSVHPFTEGVKDGVIYGRGTIDDKTSLISILEATEQLLSGGHQPTRTIYFSFGHDEEIGGGRGAIPMARYLQEQGVKAALVIDEGMAITEGLIPGYDQPLAFIGIAEKGYTSVKLQVDMAGGHSSQPESETAIDVLATAISKAKHNPLPPHMTEAMKGFINQVGPTMDFKTKFFFANADVFKPLLLDQYQKASSAGNASVRTTTSPTIFESGVKDNIIPTHAEAVINFRIIPGETSYDVMDHLTRVIDDDRIRLEIHGVRGEPSPISPIDNSAYALINTTIKEIFPDMMTSSNLVLGGTDSRHFTGVSPNIYRFAPYRITPDNLSCFHGIDERIPVSEFEDAIRFYTRFIINCNQLIMEAYFMKITILILWSFLPISAFAQDGITTLTENLDRILLWLPGEYDNHIQVYREAVDKVPQEKRHRQTHHIFARVEVSYIPGDLIYAQQSQHYDRNDLYRQRIYSFDIDQEEQAIRLTIYTPKDPSALTDCHLVPEKLKLLTYDDFILKPGCEVYWKWDGTQFNGYLKEHACNYYSERFGTTVYLNETLTLREDALLLDDRAVDREGNLVFGVDDKGPTINLKE